MRLDFQRHLKSNAHWYVFFVLAQLVVFAYYWFTWQTFPRFLEALDHDSKFMMDFTNHYYPMSRAILYGTTTDVVYLYPAFFAILLSPLGALSISSAQAIWLIVQFVCLAILFIVSARGIVKLSLGQTMLFALLWTTSFPLLHNLKWGQVSLLITACIATALLFSYWKMSVLSGLLLAFATAIKLYPAIFIVYFIVKRDWRAIITFAIAFLIFYVALPTTVMGFSNWLQFERETQSILSSVDWTEDINSQYVAHVGLRLLDLTSERSLNPALVVQGFTMIGYLIAFSCIAAVWALRNNSDETGLSLSLVAIFISLPFLVKTSWPHYFTYLPLCQIVLYRYFSSSLHADNKPSKLFILFPILSMAISSIFIFNLFPNWEIYNGDGMLFFSNFFLLIALYAAVLLEFSPRAVRRDLAPDTV